MKAVLVIDEMPESCGKCRLADFGKCWGSTSYIHMSTNDIPKECPLKPMPKEEDIYEVGMDEEDTNAKRQWNKGWNACLRRIEQ